MDLDGRTFHPFPKLPMEMQMEIWRYTLPGRRIIAVYQRPERDNSLYFKGASPPPVLHACQTSRNVASSFFKAAFTNKISPPIYMNFANDTILSVSYGAFIKLAELYPDISLIKSLAIEDRSVSGDGELPNILNHFKKIGAKLEEIVVIVGHQSHKVVEYEHPESLRFSKPGSAEWGWIGRWWTNRFPEGTTVRFMETKKDRPQCVMSLTSCDEDGAFNSNR